MLSQYPYYSHIGFLKETYPNGVYIPKSSQKIKNKKLKSKNRKRR